MLLEAVGFVYMIYALHVHSGRDELISLTLRFTSVVLSYTVTVLFMRL